METLHRKHIQWIRSQWTTDLTPQSTGASTSDCDDRWTLDVSRHGDGSDTVHHYASIKGLHAWATVIWQSLEIDGSYILKPANSVISSLSVSKDDNVAAYHVHKVSWTNFARENSSPFPTNPLTRSHLMLTTLANKNLSICPVAKTVAN